MSIVAVPVFHYGILKGYLAGQNAPSEILVAADALYAAASHGPLAADALGAVRLVTEAAEKLLARAESLPAPVERLVSIEPIRELGQAEIVPSAAIEVASEPEPVDEPTPAREEPLDRAKIDAFLEARANQSAHQSTEPKKRKEWSPEARAAAGERMRAMRAAGMIKGRVGTAGNSQASKEPLPQVIVRHPKPTRPVIEPSDDDPNDQIDDSNRVTITVVPITSPADRWSPTPLTDEDWPDIQQMLAAGKSRARIAGDYDVPLGELDVFIERKLAEAKERRSAKELSSGEA